VINQYQVTSIQHLVAYRRNRLSLKEKMKTNKETEPVEKFSGTAWQAGMVKSLHENAEIEAFMKDGIMGTFNPWWTAPGGAGAVKVFVSKEYYARAKEVVNEYERNLKENE
jgi:hypothetical protein